ncbi:MAG: hypothetical protein ACP5EP_04915 [Acidobacteriaceae bacterium]
MTHSQAVSPAKPKTAYLSVGGFYSYAQMDYGQHHAMGWGGFSDLNYRVLGPIGIGLEGEARLIDFHLHAGTAFQNYLGGPRVTYQMRHFEPYAKFLIGGSRFHYPDFISNQTFDYTTRAMGGGVDVRVTDRWYFRAVDFEDQRFTNYPPSGLTPWVLSTGVSYRLF